MTKEWPPYIFDIAHMLKERYNDFDHYNRKNPLDELLFILCSVKTTSKSYRRTYQALRREFPRFSMLVEATEEEIAKQLSPGGLSNQKASAIKGIIDEITKRFGKPTLAPLHTMSDEDCEGFLVALPGVGKKVARCVMLYSLNRQVFPVDTHVCRVCYRLGWVQQSGSYGVCSDKDVDLLQEKIPPDLRFSLHVNMVSLGREICTARFPKCQLCPIADYCPKIGLKLTPNISSPRT